MPELKLRPSEKIISWVTVESRFLIAAAICAIAGFAFTEIAEETLEGETLHLDNLILQALRSPGDPRVPIGPDWLLPVAQDISALGGMAILVVLIASVGGYFILKRKLRTLLFLLCSVFGAAMTMLLMKEFFARPRPDVVPYLAPVMHASFPSGHSMLSAIVYLTLAAMLAKSTANHGLKIYYMSIGVFLTLAVGLSRVYLGVHYPTDVLAGWCAGVWWASLSYLIARRLQRKGTVEKETE